MGALTVGLREAREALDGQIERLVEVCRTLDDAALLSRSRCHGWLVLDVVVHVRAGLEELVRSLPARTGGRPDTDAAGYWRHEPPAVGEGGDDVDATLWLRRTSSAYGRPRTAVAHLADVVTGLRRALADLPDGRLAFQGRVLTAGDVLATWAVEVCVHHLDLTAELDLDPPTPASLGLARRTVEALLDAPLPAGVGDVDAVLLGTGRVAAAPDDPLAHRLPVL